MGLSQAISGSTHQAGCTLDLEFCSDQMNGALKMRDVQSTHLSWTDHFLVRLTGTPDICKGEPVGKCNSACVPIFR